MGLLESARDSVVAVHDVLESPAWESDVCPKTAPGAERYAERYRGSARSANRNQRRAGTASRGSFFPAIFAVRIPSFSPCQSSMSSRVPGSRRFCARGGRTLLSAAVAVVLCNHHYKEGGRQISGQRGTSHLSRVSPSYLQSTLLSCAAAICHFPSRFNQVSVQAWHCFVSGCLLSLPMACSLP
jgi:hypothetical protein